jgi:hypothetical protein
MKSTVRVVAVCAAILCASARTDAAVYAFAGVIDTDNTVNPVRNFRAFSGQFSFDAAAADVAAADPHDGYYPMTGGPYGMQVTFDDGTVFDVDSAAHYTLSVHVPLASIPGQTPDTGRFTVEGDVAGQSNRFMTLYFRKSFASDALPAPNGGFDLGTFDEALFSYHGLPDMAPLPGQVPVPPFGAYGHLTSLACTAGCVGIETPLPAVPEPETHALMLAGLGALGWIGRRRRNAGA